MTTQTMAWIAGAIVTIPAVCIVVVLMLPKRTHDPHDGIAVGCLSMVVLALLLVLALIIFAGLGDHPKLMKTIYYPTVYAGGWVAFAIVGNLFMTWYRRHRIDRELAKEALARTPTEPPPPPP
jgi:Kef-type K+ transport system membrane component KefB